MDDRDPLALPDIPVPRGFRLFSVDMSHDWRNRFGDGSRSKLSLSAWGDDMSGLEELPIHALWRLECRHAAPHSYTKVSDEGVRLLAFHPELRVLNLRGSGVTGERLAPSVTIEPLLQLSLSGKQAKRARRFAAERPDVEILY